MSYNPDTYYNRPEVSNSDLSWLKKQFQSKDDFDPIEAYKFGTLIDAMITEAHRVNFYKMTVDDVQYSKEQFDLAEEMKKSFMNDPLCANLLKMSSTQAVSIQPNFKIEFEGVEFEMPVRCKWDLLLPTWGVDIKSTTATTQKQFIDAIYYFDYHRQRAWYMDIIGSDQDMLIGISKVNKKIFKVPIKLGDELYKEGKAQYQELAFKWWSLFENIKISA
jgi:hypothetical protein